MGSFRETYNAINWRDTTHFDSEDDYRTGCRNVSHCQQQQSYSRLRSPGRSNATFWNDSWVQTFYSFKRIMINLTSVSNVRVSTPISLFWIYNNLRTADAFLVVASLPPKNSYFRRERSDDRKCVCCSQARSTTDSTNYRKCVSSFLSSWLANRQWHF